MIIDTSALVAILRSEPERSSFEEATTQDPFPRISAATYLEAGIVIDGRGSPVLGRILDSLIATAEIRIESVTATQARIARQAYRDFGCGSGHPARLNFGDCFTYALATDTDEELLLKGDDFIHTDVRPGVPTNPPRTTQ